MRRFFLAVSFSATCVLSLGAQVTRGNVTLTDLAGGLTQVDVLVSAFSDPVSIGGLYFEQFFDPLARAATARLVGGALAFGQIANGDGTFQGGVFIDGPADPVTLQGSIFEDPTNFLQVVGCVVLDPIESIDGQPRYGVNREPGYFQACPAGAAVDFRFVSPRVSFTPLVTAAPEPAIVLLMATGFGVVGALLRHSASRRRREASLELRC